MQLSVCLYLVLYNLRMKYTYICIYILMHTIKVYHQCGHFLSTQYIPEIRTILLHLLYFLIRFEYCYMCVNIC